MLRKIVWSVAVVACVFAGAATQAALPFQVANWQAHDGLPSNKVMAVTQTRDGYLWAGTYEGLVRFDGVRFTSVENSRLDARVDSSITALCEGRDGTLWVGHDSGAISRYREGALTFFKVIEGSKGIRIQNIVTDAEGEVWALNVAGVVTRMRDGLQLRPESGLSRGVFEMVRTNDGTVWVSCRGKLSQLRGNAFEAVPIPPELNQWIQGIGPARDGGLWTVSGEQLWKYRRGEWSAPFGQIATGSARIYHLRELQDGRVFAGTFERGGTIVTPAPFQQQRLARETGFPSDWIFSTCEDHEGSLWVATGSAGLFRLRDEKLRMLVPEDKWQGRPVLAVTPAREGGIWATTEGAGVYHYREGVWENFGVEAGIENPYVWTVAEDADGRLFIGSWGRGVYEKVGDRFVHAPGMEKIELGIGALLPSRAGGLLVGTTNGALRYRAGAVEWLQPDPEQRLKDVRYLLEEADGTVWLACNGDGLGRIRPGEVRRFGRGDGLSSNFVRCLYQAPDGALWIGTRGGGLNRWRGERFATVTTANGLIDDVISYLQDDGRGNLWIGTHGGIMRVPLAELNACADGAVARVNPLSYGLNDGLLTLASAGPLQSSGCRLPSGEMIFATSHGLALIDPASVQVNAQPPPVVIEAVRVGDQAPLEGGAIPVVLEVPPGEHRLEVRYTALSFVAPEKVRFRRQLAGLETSPVTSGGARTAVYSFVPPGEYTFQVTAANNDNVWNPAERRLRIVVRPHFWQTASFLVLVLVALAATAAGIAWAVARRRMHRKLEMLQRDRAIEQERTRIAHEMHDDLGAHLTRITMLSDTARSDLNEPERLGQGLTQIYETARGVTRAMDEIVWAVNPRHDTMESLVCYLDKFAQDFLGSAGLRVRLDLPLDFGDWTPSSEVRHNLFLAYKEALNNAVRHSGADTVTVSLQVNATCCVVTVSDNGRGLSRGGVESDRAKTGTGLESMRRRMTDIGGRCEFECGADGGCCVTLTVPVTRTPPQSVVAPR